MALPPYFTTTILPTYRLMYGSAWVSTSARWALEKFVSMFSSDVLRKSVIQLFVHVSSFRFFDSVPLSLHFTQNDIWFAVILSGAERYKPTIVGADIIRP